MDKILHIGPPQAFGVSDGLYSFVVRLNETLGVFVQAGHASFGVASFNNDVGALDIADLCQRGEKLRSSAAGV